MGDVMKNCKFINELNRLRKSSSDSIDNVEKFDQFKSYMHVVRKMEEDLKGLLRKVNASGKKTLVLLCGSAGDGKSHLLSYLKNLDEEHLIDDYFVYNDATESSAPSKTAIETLNEFLSDYRDENLASLGQNVILAINLGVLSNFIDSKYADHFCTLRKYIENSDILTSRVNNNEYDCESNFQHISFSDYNLYSLSAEGIHADYIEKLLEKVFIADEENLFYKTYSKECLNCSLAKKCPVKLNYDYMKDKKRQRFVAELLVKTIIQDKMILTTREILNFIYDIIVSPRFSVNHFHNLCIDNSAYLKEFVKQITPALLFESADITALMNMLKRHDPLLLRSEEADEAAVSYYVSSNVSQEIKRVFENSPYYSVICDDNMLEKINTDKTIKANFYSLVARMETLDKGVASEETYKNYLQDLYWYNSGMFRKLNRVYALVEKAVMQWCNGDEEGNCCLEKRGGFSLYEKIEMVPKAENVPYLEEKEELQRFIPSITVAFEGKNEEKIKLDIDYSLYELLDKLNRGYIQTANDRNNHAEFISFINRILQTGSLDKTLTILSGNGTKASIAKRMFGYKFKVVK